MVLGEQPSHARLALQASPRRRHRHYLPLPFFPPLPPRPALTVGGHVEDAAGVALREVRPIVVHWVTQLTRHHWVGLPRLLRLSLL